MPTHRRPTCDGADGRHADRAGTPTVVFDVDDLSVLLRRLPGRARRQPRRPPARDHRVHRPVRLRQDHGAALLQPDERPHRRRPGSRARSPTTASTSTTRRSTPVEVRRRIGMVFQKPNPFPKAIYDNVAYGPRLDGVKKKARARRDRRAVAARRRAVGRGQGPARRRSALGLSGGQQQRLCIARAIAVEPEVILMDEPCSALDPIATARIEELMQEIKAEYTIVIVTHNMQQAARVSDRTAFFTTEVNPESDRRTGVLVESTPTEKIFSNPERRADRGLRHRPVRLIGPDDQSTSDDLRTGSTSELDEIRERDRQARRPRSPRAIPRATRDPARPGPRGRRVHDPRPTTRSTPGRSSSRSAATSVLALQAPVASDLRQVVAALRIIAEIERSADLAVNICKAARRIYGHQLDPRLRGIIQKMGDQAQQLFTRGDRGLPRRATPPGPPRSTTWTPTSTTCSASSSRRSSRATPPERSTCRSPCSSPSSPASTSASATTPSTSASGSATSSPAGCPSTTARRATPTRSRGERPGVTRVAAVAVAVIVVVAVAVRRAVGRRPAPLVRRAAPAPRRTPTPSPPRPSRRRGRLASCAPTWTDVVDRLPLGVVVADAERRRSATATRPPSAMAGTHIGAARRRRRRARCCARPSTARRAAQTLELYGPPRVAVVVTADAARRAAARWRRSRTSASARRLDAVRTDFVANISHELKTPVGALAVLAETLADEDDPEVVAPRCAERMVDEAHRVGAHDRRPARAVADRARRGSRVRERRRRRRRRRRGGRPRRARWPSRAASPSTSLEPARRARASSATAASSSRRSATSSRTP